MEDISIGNAEIYPRWNPILRGFTIEATRATNA
jgi:hypothetical protein